MFGWGIEAVALMAGTNITIEKIGTQFGVS